MAPTALQTTKGTHGQSSGRGAGGWHDQRCPSGLTLRTVAADLIFGPEHQDLEAPFEISLWHDLVSLADFLFWFSPQNNWWCFLWLCVRGASQAGAPWSVVDISRTSLARYYVDTLHEATTFNLLYYFSTRSMCLHRNTYRRYHTYMVQYAFMYKLVPLFYQSCIF